jgi:hypothetical protein
MLSTFYKNKELGLGTGFFYSYEGSNYLITNWHIVAGRHFQTLKPVSPNAGLPDRLKISLPKKGGLGSWVQAEVLLYIDAFANQPNNPNWFEHPNHHYSVDVVAIPFATPADAEIYPANILTTAALRLIVSLDVFVIGYPKGLTGGGRFPIWKRASIESEPGIDLDELPKMLVDTATREGMSGSPVVAVAFGSYTDEQGNVNMGAGVRASRFVGVYSGRLGDNEMEAQLGIVWKANVLNQIIRGKAKGPSSFLL